MSECYATVFKTCMLQVEGGRAVIRNPSDPQHPGAQAIPGATTHHNRQTHVHTYVAYGTKKPQATPRAIPRDTPRQPLTKHNGSRKPRAIPQTVPRVT